MAEIPTTTTTPQGEIAPDPDPDTREYYLVFVRRVTTYRVLASSPEDAEDVYMDSSSESDQPNYAPELDCETTSINAERDDDQQEGDGPWKTSK